ncbi:uroporphyrinogen-III C-methyltransferase [uncultured Aquimarina sp.]|uniref:uroporphyrinogen-III C-methyltransferase n=1 Tax=uncultured Aquimarina sp. TaxID=575652 RepID=UPI002623F629|nr:uroporphyrinogen-III C-methyltransferase [uncultured Aquimarina sp.]
MNTHISILGLGWLGLPLALQLQKRGYSVNGSTAELDALKSLCKYSFLTSRIKIDSDTIIGDWESFINETSTLIINFPPKRIDNIEVVHPLQIEQIIKHTPRSTKVIFVSSTSVYQNSNNLINETEDCAPEKTSGRALLKAEQLLQQYFRANITIVRLAGLIGPQRNPGRLLADKKQLKNPNVPVNLIHQKDAIDLIEAILEQNCFGEIINGCSDMHPKRKEFYENAAIQLSLPTPVFHTITKENFKIVDNSKSKSLLNFEYQFSNPEWIFTKKHLPEINIIGAGPGNKNLLTLKALEAIEKADVILHDNLISDEILDINTQAKRMYVGRKFGDSENQETRQNKINTLMKNHCERGDKVVRLKSGDPYVYGRAAEEARFLKKHKLPFTVVPGISAALAAANICNIPITERNQSNAMLICTAHTADYSFEQLNGIAHMLKAGNTISIYMGLKNLHRIVPKLLEVCKDDRIPVNAISSVSRKQQAIVTGNLGNIEEKITNATIQMPVVFIIGATPI